MGKSNNLDDFLTDLANTIREKKGTNEPINAQDFSSEIASIQSGGRDWSEIGYEAEPQSIEDGFAYAKEIKENWNELSTYIAIDKEKLIYFPKLNAPNLKSLENTFNDCRLLIYVGDLITPSITSMRNAFRYCSFRCQPNVITKNVVDMYNMYCYCMYLKIGTEIDMSNAEIISGLYYNCTNLIAVAQIKSVKATEMVNVFSYCSKLTKIELIDLCSVSKMSGIFTECKSLRFVILNNLGKSTLDTYDFSGATNWGVATTDIPDAKQSLIDSLITYSYDRASNGMSTATIKLSANTKALLTEEEIAQITAKGFTVA